MPFNFKLFLRIFKRSLPLLFFFELSNLNAQPSVSNIYKRDSLSISDSLNHFQSKEKTSYWWFPGTKNFTGNFQYSLGLQFWDNYFHTRNMQFRTQLNIINGIRMNSVIRSNKDRFGTKNFNPFFDELYLEFFGYRICSSSNFSYSLRLGSMRYIRFPFSDFISTFDQVPGVQDLNKSSTTKTSFDGALLVLDYKLFFGMGFHGTYMGWIQNPVSSKNIMESYLYFKKNYKFLNFEIRSGLLQQRPEPLGRSAIGVNSYLGIHWRGIKVGGLLEKLEKYSWYAGVLISFSPSYITNLLGTIHADYTRSPKGIAFQVPIFNGDFGYVKPKNIDGEKVGEIVSERRMTFWQNSQTRNFYEHQFSKQGITSGDSVVACIDEYSWYLKNESPVGPLKRLQNFNDILNWDKSSARLGEIAQPVVYSFYKKGNIKYKNKFSIKPGIQFKNLKRNYKYKELSSPIFDPY